MNVIIINRVPTEKIWEFN